MDGAAKKSISEPAKGVVVGHGNLMSHIYQRKKLWLATLVAVLIIAVGVVVYLAVRQTPAKQLKAAAQRAAQQNVNFAKLNNTSRLGYLTEQGNYVAAEEQLHQEISAAKTAEAKMTIYVQQALIAVQFKHYSDATNYTTQAKSADANDPAPYEVQAELDKAQGNKAAAAQALQQAIAKVNPNAPAANLQVEDYEAQLKAVQ